MNRMILCFLVNVLLSEVPEKKSATMVHYLLQTDIQKILRNARKLPEKQQNFYKVCVFLSSKVAAVFFPFAITFFLSRLRA